MVENFENDTNEACAQTSRMSSSGSSDKLFNHFFPEDRAPQDFEEFRMKMNDELEKYKVLLYAKGQSIIKTTKSTSSFWREISDKLPMLAELAEILLNINSSSASIERFFSICGLVQNKRACNSDSQFFIFKCVLRANLDNRVMSEKFSIDRFVWKLKLPFLFYFKILKIETVKYDFCEKPSLNSGSA